MHLKFDIDGEVISRSAKGNKAGDGTNRSVTIAYGTGSQRLDFADDDQGAAMYAGLPATGQPIRVVGRVTQTVYQGQAFTRWTIDRIGSASSAADPSALTRTRAA